MSSLPVVECLDVLADLCRGFLPGVILPVVDQFPLERTEKAFHRGIVPVVPLATPRRLHLELLHQLLMAVGAILAATIGEMDQPPWQDAGP